MERVLSALVVDSNETMRKILVAALGKEGFDTAELDHVIGGFERLSTQPPLDLLVVDCMAPAAGGTAWLAEARRLAPPTTRILMVSGETRKARIAAALDAGADEYLMKPFPQEALHEKLVIMGLAE